jgi:hypothetical protein
MTNWPSSLSDEYQNALYIQSIASAVWYPLSNRPTYYRLPNVWQSATSHNPDPAPQTPPQAINHDPLETMRQPYYDKTDIEIGTLFSAQDFPKQVC